MSLNFRKLRPFLSLIFGAAGLYFILRYAFENADRYREMKIDVNPVLFLPAVLMMAAGYIFEVLGWRKALLLQGVRTGYLEAFFIFFAAVPGLYIPFKGIHIAGRVYFGDYHGVPAGKVLAGTFMEIFYGVMIAGLIASGSVFFMKLNRLYYLIPAASLIFFIISPFLFRFFLDIFRKLTGHNIPVKPVVKTTDHYMFSLIFVFARLLMGVSFYFTYSAVFGPALEKLPAFAVFWSTAWVAGNLAIIFPKGVGVREGILVFLLKPLTGGPPAFAAAVINRFLNIILDLLFGGISVLRYAGRKK